MTDNNIKCEEKILVTKQDLFELLAELGSLYEIKTYAEKYDFTVEEYNEWWERSP